MGVLQKLLEEGKLTAAEVEEITKELTADIAQKLEKLQAENETLKQELQTTRTQLEKEREELKTALEKAKKEGNLDKIKEYEEKLAEKEQTLQDLQAKLTDYKVSTTLSQMLDKFNVIDKEVVAAALRGKIEVDENGEIKFEGGKALDEGLSEFFKERPHLIRGVGKAGSGVSGAGGDGVVTKRRSEMSDVEKAQFIKEHGQEAYLNLPE